MLDLQEQFSSQPFKNHHALPAFAPFGQPSMKVGFGVGPHAETRTSAGRKRSRDEAAIDLEDSDFSQQDATAAFESQESREYTEGTTPNGLPIDADSQTRTWAEEMATLSLPVTPPMIQERPRLRNHKSQRLDLSAISAITEKLNTSVGHTPSSSPIRQSPTRREPTVDDFTMHLGIGWSRISSDEDMQAAARGWAKYIDNHFQITEPKILLQSRGLASYLVEAREGWFLFGEDLTQGRLVATSLDRTFEHLRISPPVFDGDEIMVVLAETTKTSTEAPYEVMMDTPHIYAGSMNRRKEYLNNSEMEIHESGAHGPDGQAPDDRMDMS